MNFFFFKKKNPIEFIAKIFKLCLVIYGLDLIVNFLIFLLKNIYHRNIYANINK